ncbi:hypothetical protein Cni_G20945 [Canna indica]|uniref:Peptidase A1 domain-containing protein n=1 Tax=Canna indica TaxID=4628 RepID=A0AAQ3QL84_9LILI|nr:hypothetical protein Cni_G20945 [Canna indica]
MTARIQVRQVWSDHVQAEFALVHHAIKRYHFVALDTEYPGVIYRDPKHFTPPISPWPSVTPTSSSMSTPSTSSRGLGTGGQLAQGESNAGAKPSSEIRQLAGLPNFCANEEVLKGGKLSPFLSSSISPPTATMPSSPSLPLRLSILLIFFLVPFSASSAPVFLPLRSVRLPPHPDPLHRLAAVASSSALRASLLKNPRRHHSSPPHSTQSPLFPHSYGGYSFDLAIGTPPQQLSLLLDTGSHLNWVACTTSYECRRCSSPSSASITPFLPKSSASTRIVGCHNPHCLWIHPAGLLQARCPACNATACPATACPPYALIYGSGSTAGLLILETLQLSNLTVTNFTVGCSVFSERQPAAGIAAFGRGSPSLPSQLGLKRFSYCLISRHYDDDAAERGSVVLDPPKEDSSNGLSFAHFINNSAASAGEGSPFSVYYYIGLHEITVGGKKVKVPQSAFVPGPSGDGGAIIDSGTTFTYMAPQVFEPVLAAFANRLAGRYNRSTALEGQTGLGLCFALPPNATDVQLPELTFHFKGGADMRLPLENYFVIAGSDASAVCLAIVSDVGAAAASSDAGGGPAIILGSFQQQDYYMVYDLERGRLGFRRQSCLGS